jgi:trk system potassium uptake protein TrkH
VRDRFGSKRVVRANVVSKPDKLTVIDNGEKADILSFVLLFLLIYGVGVFIVSCYGYELQSVMFDVASCMGTVGLNVGIMVSGAPAGVLWVGIATMLLGRLEIYVIIFAVLRIALDAKRRLTKNV